MDRKSWLVGLVMGLCLGAGIGGLYVGINGGNAFVTLAESTALGTFGDLEWEILYYQVRGLDVVSFQNNEQFLYQFNEYISSGGNVLFTEVTRSELRNIILGFMTDGVPIYINIVFDMPSIYVRDIKYQEVNEIRFYQWSPIS